MDTKKIVLSLLIILIAINIIFLPISYASTLDDIFDSADNFVESGEDPESVMDKNKFKETSTTIYKILLSIAICVSVIVGAGLGIQFILGSVEGKVKVQEALVPYIIGCFVVFGAFTIWGIVVNMGNNIEGSSTITSTTFTRQDGKLYCDNCNDELNPLEQRRAKCSNCGMSISGI